MKQSYRRPVSPLLAAALAVLCALAGLAAGPNPAGPPETPTPAPGSASVRTTDGMVTSYVPAAEFRMGSSEAAVDAAIALGSRYYKDPRRSWFEDEKPQHLVALDAFRIDRTEVTQAQYGECVAAGACGATGPNAAGEDRPVVNVTWDQARTYCAWAGARLPTEAEWEYAARGLSGSLFPWGNEWDTSRTNAAPGGRAGSAPVGSYPSGASWCGALDLSGNVAEWVADGFGAVYPTERQVNPLAPANYDWRVVRGGAWPDLPLNLRGAARDGHSPTSADPFIGFRCAAPADPPRLP